MNFKNINVDIKFNSKKYYQKQVYYKQHLQKTR